MNEPCTGATAGSRSGPPARIPADADDVSSWKGGRGWPLPAWRHWPGAGGARCQPLRGASIEKIVKFYRVNFVILVKSMPSGRSARALESMPTQTTDAERCLRASEVGTGRGHSGGPIPAGCGRACPPIAVRATRAGYRERSRAMQAKRGGAGLKRVPTTARPGSILVLQYRVFTESRWRMAGVQSCN